MTDRPDPVETPAARGAVLDRYLVARARLGDERAFAELVRRWHRRLTAHAWRLTGETEMAQDAVQAAWTEIVSGLPKLKDEAAFPAWAYRIVSRRCGRAIAGRRRDRALAAAVAAEPAELASMPADPPDRRGAIRLQQAIASLPAAQRAALGLFYGEGLSVAETAVALDVPAGTVKTRLMHARRALRAALEKE